MLKEIASILILFTVSFYISHLYNDESDIKKINEKGKKIETVSGHKTVLIKSGETTKTRLSSSKTIKREVASSNIEEDLSLKNSVKEEMPINKVDISTLEKTTLSTAFKIEMIQNEKIDLGNRSKTKKVILNELMGISFVQRNIASEESDDISDMGKYLESLSPPDNEIYFFELFNQLTKVVDSSELKKISLDLYERVDNTEVKGLIVLHLLDNDVENENLNFLVENLSEDKVLKHTPDNYIIEKVDGKSLLVINNGPVYDDESDLVDSELNENNEFKNEEIL